MAGEQQSLFSGEITARLPKGKPGPEDSDPCAKDMSEGPDASFVATVETITKSDALKDSGLTRQRASEREAIAAVLIVSDRGSTVRLSVEGARRLYGPGRGRRPREAGR